MGNKIKNFKIGDAVIQVEAGWSTSGKDNGKMAIITDIDEENDQISLFGDEKWEAKYKWRHINGFESVNEMIKKLPQPIQKEEEGVRRHEHIPLDNGKVVYAWDIDCPECKKGIKHFLGEIFADQLPFIKTPTPSDTFIEEKIWEQIQKIEGMACPVHGLGTLTVSDADFCDFCQECAEEDNDNEPPELMMASDYIEKLFKSSLQSQRQSILEEIEKKKFDELVNGKLTEVVMLEDIKQLLK